MKPTTQIFILFVLGALFVIGALYLAHHDPEVSIFDAIQSVAAPATALIAIGIAIYSTGKADEREELNWSRREKERLDELQLIRQQARERILLFYESMHSAAVKLNETNIFDDLGSYKDGVAMLMDELRSFALDQKNSVVAAQPSHTKLEELRGLEVEIFVSASELKPEVIRANETQIRQSVGALATLVADFVDLLSSEDS